jgi:ADP-heptose:LPS heptosyltransferase
VTILIKSPLTDRDFIASVPFLQALLNHYENEKIAYLVQEEQQDLFDYLPQGLSLYSLPKEKDNFLGVHRYSVNETTLFNIKTYVDLRGDLSSSYLGYCFKAKKRIGSAKGLHRYFYTDQVINTENLKFDDKVDLIYSKLLETTLDIMPIQPSKQSSNVVKLFENDVPEEYLLVLIDLSLDDQDQWWIEYLNGFEKQKFIIVESSNYSHLDRFYKNLDRKNEYLFDENPDAKRLLNLASKTKGVLSNHQTLSWLLAKEGIDVLCFTNEESFKVPRIQYVPLIFDSKKESINDLIQKTHHELKL